MLRSLNISKLLKAPLKLQEGTKIRKVRRMPRKREEKMKLQVINPH